MATAPAPPPRTKLGQHRLLCPNAPILVSPVCLGAMGFGQRLWGAAMGGCNKETSYEILDRFHDAGGNFIDTANFYMGGESEEWLGDWMADRGVRDQMIIATKFALPFKFPEQFPEGTITSNFGGANRKSLRLSLAESLQRMRTDYVDILYVHAWDGVTNIPELMRSLDDVVKQGKVLYLGISNWPAWLVVKANDYARQHCLTPFVVYEGLWNVVARDIERDIVPMCKAEGMAITVWEAMGAGKFKTKAEKAEKGGRPAYDLSGKGLEAYERATAALERVAKRKGTNAVGVALRYVTLKEPYVFPIIGCRKIEQLQANIENLSVKLSEDDMREIEEAVPIDLGYPHAFLSGLADKHVGPTRPSKLEVRWGGFEGVEEPKLLSTQQVANTSQSEQDADDFNLHADRKCQIFPTSRLDAGESRICEQLRAALPPYNALRQCFSGDTKWWDFWHIKTFGPDAPKESILQFLERVYMIGTPIELGFLVSSYGRHHAAEASEYLAVVDRLVLASDRFARSVEGLLLAVFHAKVYLDNLHRNYSSSHRRSAAWWTLYLGDRFLSILLGLPYSISDNSFIVTYASETSQLGYATLPFAIRLGMITGRVIDQVQSRKGPKFSEIVDIDDELTTLASTKPRHWWDHKITADACSTDLNESRERLICQTQYFLTRIYLHLPYLLKSPTSHLYVSSRLTAIESARELLKRYQVLRSYVDGSPIFDCQSLDFVGFMAAVILVVAAFCGSGDHLLPDDMELSNETLKTLQRVAENRVNGLARQCQKTLATLLVLAQEEDSLNCAVPPRIKIPYFGTLYVALERHLKSSSLKTSRDHGSSPAYPGCLVNSSSSGMPSADLNPQSPKITYEGMYSFDSDLPWAQDEFQAVSGSLDFMTDLDQGWESFFNSQASSEMPSAESLFFD
ncbi:hypothetical protein AYO21_05692 [Fonsecaea monophora]|uniref:NADP-dependent oxidoreductase domain-containing protein n=1 Tax=Fonsecaea monophora TaxID=254056 RepID=A0A177F8I8_9EURO|nr:hypothetical protein AYO21_05692 [Fonsecaea monophora]OAG40011.1 hypothetical protein AYO21_05692 [Fonsecaea monophora]